MKINVTVDLAEFYTQDDEQSFSDEIKCEIASKVKSQVWRDFELKALDQLKDLVSKEFNKSKDENVVEIVKHLFANKKIKRSDNNSSEMITIEEYLIAQLEKDYFSARNSAESVMRNFVSNFEDKFNRELKQSSESISKELKDRYDLLFASQIVTKLNENGMLKNDVAKLLLNSENEG